MLDKPRCVTWALDNGADLSQADSNGASVLDVASPGCIEAVKQHGRDTNWARRRQLILSYHSHNLLFAAAEADGAVAACATGQERAFLSASLKNFLLNCYKRDPKVPPSQGVVVGQLQRLKEDAKLRRLLDLPPELFEYVVQFV